MIVTCASCSTRYIVDGNALGPNGRMVRCANCSNTWFQSPSAAAIPSSRSSAIPFERKLPPSSNLPAYRQAELKRSGTLGWLILLLAVLGMMAGLLLGRQTILAAWPPAGKLYEAIGLNSTIAGFGLDFRNVATKLGEDGKTLVLDGTIINISTRSRTIPPLIAAIKRADNNILASWSIKPNEAALAPGQTTNFHAEFIDPPKTGHEMIVSFGQASHMQTSANTP